MISKNFLKLTSFVLGLSAFSASVEARLVEQNDFDFGYDARRVGNDLWTAYELVERGNFAQLKSQSPNYRRVAEALYPNGIGEGSYYALIARSVFLVHASRDLYARAENLFDVRFLEKTLGKQGIQKVSAHTFKIPGGGFNPGYTLDQDLFGSTAELRRSKHIDVSHLPLAKVPNPVILAQDARDFGKVMGQDTSRDFRYVGFYSEISPDLFLVESTTIMHLYNVPPGLFGGTSRLKNDYLKVMRESVERMQNYRP